MVSSSNCIVPNLRTSATELEATIFVSVCGFVLEVHNMEMPWTRTVQKWRTSLGDGEVAETG